MSTPLVRAGQFWFRHRGALLPIAVLLYIIPSPELMEDSTVPGLVGFAVALVGQAIRTANVGFEYIIRGGKDYQVYAEKLVTGGLYQHVRNPMYVGNFFLMLGLAIASNSWVFLLAGVPIAFMVHVAIIAAEEDFLRGKFGAEFDAFCARSPRWVPRLAGLGQTLGGMTFNTRRVLVKEYQKAFDWIAALALVVIINHWREPQFVKDFVVIGLMATVIVVRVGLNILARRLARAT